MVRWILVSLLLASAVSCRQVEQSSLRFSKDIFVVATAPANLPVAAVRDTYKWAGEDEWLVGSALFIPVLAINLLKHSFVVLTYAVDAPFYPIYMPLGLRPMRIYTIDDFPYTTDPGFEDLINSPFTRVSEELDEREQEARRRAAADNDEERRDFFDPR